MSTRLSRCPVCGESKLHEFRNRAERQCLNPECEATLAEADLARLLRHADWAPDPWPSDLDTSDILPFIRYPILAWKSETHPTARLWRICDAADVLLRLINAIGLALAAERGGGRLPRRLADEFGPSLRHPTLGTWIAAARRLLPREQPPDAPAVVTDAAHLLHDALFPALGSAGAQPADGIHSLRNWLAHAGGLSRTTAISLLDQHEPRARSAFSKARPWLESFTGEYTNPERGSRILGSVGSAMWQSTKGQQESESLLLQGRDGRSIDIWPWCAASTSVSPTPEVYVKRVRGAVLYNVLGGDTAYSTYRGRRLARLRELFGHETHAGSDEMAGLRAEADELIGRDDVLDEIVQAVLHKEEGVYWVQGVAGVGKSKLAAAVASHGRLSSNPRHRLVIPHFFRAGTEQCSRGAFLQKAIRMLVAWPPLRESIEPTTLETATTSTSLENGLAALLSRVAELRTAGPSGARVLFVLDGLDEVAAADPEFASLVGEHTFSRVAWICFGRPGAHVEPLRRTPRFQHVFANHPDGMLPPLKPSGVRQMLLHEFGTSCADLVRNDIDASPSAGNPFVEAVVARSEGLPQYIKLVVDDVLQGKADFANPSALPLSVAAYHAQLLEQYELGDVQQVATPLIATLAVTREPLDVEALLELMVFRTVLPDTSKGRDRLDLALTSLGSILRTATTSWGTAGYVVYHESFRELILESKRFSEAVATAKRALEDVALLWNEWRSDLRRYCLAHGLGHLVSAGRPDGAADLLTDFGYLDARMGAFGGAEARRLMEDAVALQRLSKQKSRWDLFFSAHLHRLVRGRDSVLLQQALAEPPGSAIRECATRWLAQSDERRPSLTQLAFFGDPESRPVQIYEPQEGRTNCLALLPDEGTVVSGGDDGATVWRLHDGRIIHRWRNHGEASPKLENPSKYEVFARERLRQVCAVAVDSSGLHAATGGRDQTVRVWRLDDGALVKTLREHRGQVSDVLFLSPNRLLSGCTDGVLRLWDPSGGTLLSELMITAEHPIPYWGGSRVSLDTRQSLLLHRVDDRFVDVRDINRRLGTVEAADNSLRFVSTEPVSTGVLPSGGGLDTWDADAERYRRLPHLPYCNAAVACGSQRWATTGGDRTLRLWDVAEHKEVGAVASPSDEGGALAWRRGADELLVAFGHVERWPISNITRSVAPGHASPTALCISPDSSRAASVGRDDTVICWDLKERRHWRQQAKVRGLERTLWSVTFAKSGERIFTGNFDGFVEVWDASGIHLGVVDLQTSGAVRAMIAVDGRVLCVDSDGQIFAIDDETLEHRTVATLPKATGFYFWAGVGHSGQLVAAAKQDGVVAIDVESGSMTAKFAADAQMLTNVGVAPATKALMTLHENGRLRRWVDGELQHETFVGKASFGGFDNFAVDASAQFVLMERERQLELRSTEDGSLVGSWQTDGDARPFMFMPDGDILHFQRGQLARLRAQ